MSIVIGTNYVWNIVAASVLNLQAASFVWCAIKQKKRLDLPHHASVGSRETEKLSDEDNEEFTRFQTVKDSYLEYLPIVQSSVLLGGLFFPKVSAYASLGYIVGRLLYSIGYIKSGPDGKKLGDALICPSIITLFGATFYGSIKALGFV
ncbi:hypothetical protein DL89DRAFT_267053 [Linderina pennispora]|uniref:Membrane-associated proteins in eicosanoid and glutathione metabolism n=1 Tax=Linderina pennispora TaxID=61395 RepID=A0A1Y1WCB4_9FUNG|nr:uncharacterized protein DL89DRAFT_267053 [Linderina pennispora]ORX70958.1 hypothetical protein DL89DRAFT_267053 [Linderina pennispora]